MANPIGGKESPSEEMAPLAAEFQKWAERHAENIVGAFKFSEDLYDLSGTLNGAVWAIFLACDGHDDPSKRDMSAKGFYQWLDEMEARAKN